MSGIALNASGTAVFDGDQNAAGVGAIVGTGGVDGLLHCFDYTGQFSDLPCSHTARAQRRLPMPKPTES